MTLNIYYASQNCMNEAIKIIFNEVFKKITNCAKFYKINRNTFSRKLHEKNFWSAQIAFNKRFINIEKYFLMIYIQYYDEKNLSIILKLLIKVANLLIHARNFSTKSIENFWFNYFLKRHSKSKRLQKNLKYIIWNFTNERSRSNFKYYKRFKIIISLFMFWFWQINYIKER